MKTIALAAALGLAVIGAPAAQAGCLGGAAVGGIAGHMAGHGVLGAAAGCAVGHHMSNNRRRAEQARMNSDQPSDMNGNGGYNNGGYNNNNNGSYR